MIKPSYIVILFYFKKPIQATGDIYLGKMLRRDCLQIKIVQGKRRFKDFLKKPILTFPPPPALFCLGKGNVNPPVLWAMISFVLCFMQMGSRFLDIEHLYMFRDIKVFPFSGVLQMVDTCPAKLQTLVLKDQRLKWSQFPTMILRPGEFPKEKPAYCHLLN